MKSRQGEQVRESGGLEQLLDAKAREDGRYETYSNYFSRPFGADAKDVRLKRLKVGAQVIGGTILGRVGKVDPEKAAQYFRRAAHALTHRGEMKR